MSFNDTISRKKIIEYFPKKYLPEETFDILSYSKRSICDLRGIDVCGKTTILIEVQVRKKWGSQRYSDWTSSYYGDENWGHSTEERKWKNHFQKYKDLTWIYIILNNSLDRCIFATRKSILLGVTKKRFTSFKGHEEFKHTNDYTEITL